MRDMVVVAIYASTGLYSGSAYADWQYTRWGMSPEQVVAASDNTVRPAKEIVKTTDGQQTKMLEGTYQTGAFSFQSAFYFNLQNQLSAVQLSLRNVSDCPSLWGTMQTSYGPPEVSKISLGQFAKWWDKDSGNAVVLSDIRDLWCKIDYMPIKQAGAKGGL